MTSQPILVLVVNHGHAIVPLNTSTPAPNWPRIEPTRLPIIPLSYSPTLGAGQKCLRILFSNYPLNLQGMVFLDFVLVLCVCILLQRDNITAGSSPLPEERVLLGGI